MLIIGSILLCPIKKILINHGSVAAYPCGYVWIEAMGAHCKAPCVMVLWRVLLITAMPPRWALLERVECLSSLGHSPLALTNLKYMFVKAFCAGIDQRIVLPYHSPLGAPYQNNLGWLRSPIFMGPIYMTSQIDRKMGRSESRATNLSCSNVKHGARRNNCVSDAGWPKYKLWSRRCV